MNFLVLNPSDGLGYYPSLITFFGTYGDGVPYTFISYWLSAYRNLCYNFYFIVLECIPLFIFKVMGYIWNANPIFVCVSASSINYLVVYSYTPSTLPPTSSVTSPSIEISTSSAAAVTTVSGIDTALYEAPWWRFCGWLKSSNQRRNVSKWIYERGWVWQPADVDFYLQLCIWLHDLV